MAPTRTLLGLAAALSLVVAAPAAAGPATQSLGSSHGLEYTKAKLAGVFAQAGPEARCAGGDQVTGGGGTISMPTQKTRLNATYTFSDGGGTGWAAEGSATAGSARAVSAYAICGPNAVTYEDSMSGLGDNVSLIASASCPPSAPDPTGGGGFATGDGIDFNASIPRLPPSTPTGWTPIVLNRSGTDTVWNSTVVCSSTYELRYRESEPTRVKPGEIGGAVANCRPKEAVIGGGFAGTRDDIVGFHTPAQASRPKDSAADGNEVPDDGWQAKILNLEDFKLNAVAHAVCLHE